ncbi:MAG: SDR family NAD(P)-dependent oxidoreductase [Bacteroidia bacterium]|nr:SDR family NAD(P)-dependent oxidoreductase [Bacteroidia bacterium]
MKNILIITGTSKGLGEALAQKYLSEGFVVFGLSRNRGEIENEDFHFVETDLGRPEAIEIAWNKILIHLDLLDKASEIHFIHNAGILGPVHQIGQAHGGSLHGKALQVNLASAIDLSERIVGQLGDGEKPLKVVYISSGAGKKPYPGWANYCASKAGLDMLARVLAKEQEGKDKAPRVASIAPGVVDTPMQSQIRNTAESNFPNLQRFLDLKKNNQLWSPEFVADKMFGYIQSDGFGQETIVDLRNI